MVTEKKNKLLLNFISLGSVQGLSSLIQLIVIPFVISKVGIDGYGVIAVAQVVMFFLTIIVDYSFNQTATRSIALEKKTPQLVSITFSAVFITRLLLCLAAFIFLLILILVVPYFRTNAIVYIYGFLFVAGQAIMIPWLFQGLERMHFTALAVLFSRIVFAILVFIFIRSKNDLHFFLFFLGAGSLAAGVLSLVVASRIYPLKWTAVTWPAIQNELKGGWRIALSHFSNCICNYSSVLILRIFATDLIVGYYSVAERIYFTIKQVFHAFSQAIYPRVCVLTEQGSSSLYKFMRRSYVPFLAATVIVATLIFLFAESILYFFMGDANIHALFFMRVFCIISVVVCLNIPGTVILLARNMQGRYFRVYLLASIINILCHFILAYFFLGDGTVTAIFITEFFITMALTRSIYQKDFKTTRHAESLPVETGF